MNRGRISISVFLCFLIMMFLMVIGCSSGGDDAPAPSPTYTVTFDSQDATVAASPTSKTVTSPATTVVTLPTPPTKTGHTFAGWHTAISGGGPEFTASTAVTANITVYAYWSTNSVYTVTYNSAGGTDVGAQHVTLPATTVVTLPAAPTKIGYIFGGWYTGINGTGTAFIASTIVAADITVYAKWNSYTYTVTFDSQDATVAASPTSKTVTSPETTVVTLPTPPTKNGYTFAGWHTAISGGGPEFTASTAVTANITVYAYWSTSSVYTVTFDSQGGTAVDAQHVTSPATTVVTLPAAPTKTDYTFGGWYTEINGGGIAFTASTTVAADITVYAKWTAVTTAFTQADITGTWYVHGLKTGSDNKWSRGILTFNSSGNLTAASSCLDSAGSTTCPAAGDLQWTINASGVISEGGTDPDAEVHMTMTSNKNFIAGTAGTTGGSNSKLRIAQKVVSGTSYSDADVQSKSFVYHQLLVGSDPGWTYAVGSTDATGLTTESSEIDSWGINTPGTGGILHVDANGVVTASAETSFSGFLSADKKTIVATNTKTGGGAGVRLMVIQITGQTYTAGTLPAGISASHMLACGASPAPFWLHFTSTIASGGVITISDWVSSNSGITNPGTTDHGSISTSGTVTITEKPTYHGQVSDDGKFTVATQTLATGAYSLQVSTK